MVCNFPIKCNWIFSLSFFISDHFWSASWTLFSPKWMWPNDIKGSTFSIGKVLLTTIIVTFGFLSYICFWTKWCVFNVCVVDVCDAFLTHVSSFVLGDRVPATLRRPQKNAILMFYQVCVLCRVPAALRRPQKNDIPCFFRRVPVMKTPNFSAGAGCRHPNPGLLKRRSCACRF